MTIPEPRGRLQQLVSRTKRWPRGNDGADLQVTADNIFQYRRLAARLTTYDGNLGEIDGVVDADSSKDILKLVDETIRASSC